jgi:hypothetical protein
MVLWVFALVGCAFGNFAVDFSGASYLPASNGTMLFSWYFQRPNSPLVLWLNGGEKPFCGAVLFAHQRWKVLVAARSWACSTKLDRFRSTNLATRSRTISRPGQTTMLFCSWTNLLERVSHTVEKRLSKTKDFSKKKKGSNVVSNEEEAAYDLGLALSFFFKKHPELNGEAIYLATEVLFLFRFLIDGLLIGTIQSHTVARFVCLLFVFSHSVLTMMVFSTLRSSP